MGLVVCKKNEYMTELSKFTHFLLWKYAFSYMGFAKTELTKFLNMPCRKTHIYHRHACISEHSMLKSVSHGEGISLMKMIHCGISCFAASPSLVRRECEKES